MDLRKKLDISAYFIVGPENTLGRDVGEMIKDVVKAGFTIIQIRSKVASARELIELTRQAAEKIAELGKENEVALVVNDRLDVVLAARDLGIKVDGIHVGQSDIPVDICRKYLGQDSIIGLSAKTVDLIDYVKSADVSDIDYFGAGPLHPTKTKPEAGYGKDGKLYTKSYEDIRDLAKISPIPVVIGGGVKPDHLPELAETGIDGFFVVSAISEAEDPKEVAKEMVETWKKYKEGR